MFSSDQSQLYNLLPISEDLVAKPELLPQKMNDLYKRIANAVNSKESGLYTLRESATGQSYFQAGNPGGTRNVYRMTINFGALPNTATKSVAHGIAFDTNFSVTQVYGAATDPTALTYIPLPYASPTDTENIELYLDGTNVNVETGSNRTNFTRCTIVIEYTKNT